MANRKTILKIENLTKRFGTVTANDSINLELQEGEIMAILGENGSGKTTLINMISGVYFPDEGSIYIGENQVCIRSPKEAPVHMELVWCISITSW